MLVIGVGNAYRGDDAVGLVVAERLSALAPPAVEVIGHPGDPVSLMDSWDRRHVFLVDAVTAGGAAGTVHRLDLLAAPVRPAWATAGPTAPASPKRSSWPGPWTACPPA